jgi:Protein of unknown function (DUF3108)
MRPLTLATAVLILAQCPLARAELPDWLQQGERATYSVSYLGLVGGTMVLEASLSSDPVAVHLAMRTTSSAFVSRFFTVDDQLETLLDPVRMTALLSRKRTREGKHSLDETVRFDADAGTARRWKNGRERQPLRTPPPVLDTLGAIYVLRTLALAPGASFQLQVQSGDRVYPMVVAVVETRRVSTELGPMNVFVMEPRFAQGGLLGGKGKTVLWIGVEPPHDLVRIAAELPVASLVARLVKIERPWRAMVESSSEPGGNGKE